MTSLAMPIAGLPELPSTWSLEQPWRPPTTARVLIVEDDADLRNGLTLWLRHQGYDTYSAGDGAAGLRAIEEVEPDVLVLDLGLPRMHGFKVLHQLRHRAISPPRTLVLTAASSPDIAARALQSGADEVMQKPAEPKALLRRIDELLHPE